MTVAFSLVLGRYWGGGWYGFGDMQVLAWVAGRVPTRGTPTGDGPGSPQGNPHPRTSRGQAGVGNEGLGVGLVDSAWGWNYHLGSPRVSLWRSGRGG